MAWGEFPSLPQFPHLYSGTVPRLGVMVGRSGREAVPQREPSRLGVDLCLFMTVPPTPMFMDARLQGCRQADTWVPCTPRGAHAGHTAPGLGGSAASSDQVPGPGVGPLPGRWAPDSCWQRCLEFHGEKQMVLEGWERCHLSDNPRSGGKLRPGAVGWPRRDPDSPKEHVGFSSA